MLGCLADNHVPYALVHALRSAGVDIETTQERGLDQADDEVIAEAAISDQRLVLTNDTDFLRLSAEACQTGNPFPPVVFWPRSGKRTVQQLIERITPLTAIADYQSLCNLILRVNAVDSLNQSHDQPSTQFRRAARGRF